MSAALQVYYTAFDAVLLKLPPALQTRIERKIDDLEGGWTRFPTAVWSVVTGIVSGSAITGSYTLSLLPRARSISSL